MLCLSDLALAGIKNTVPNMGLCYIGVCYIWVSLWYELLNESQKHINQAADILNIVPLFGNNAQGFVPVISSPMIDRNCSIPPFTVSSN